MHCQEGDIAIIIRGRSRNIGNLVRVMAVHGNVDYSHMGYGILHCWWVESLGEALDTVVGPSPAGFIPDLALRKICPGASMARLTAEEELQLAIDELASVFRLYEQGAMAVPDVMSLDPVAASWGELSEAEPVPVGPKKFV